jgi:uncharacterized damage-inducible protein DinB
LYQTIDDFGQDWKAESKETLRVLRTLTDQSLNQRVMPDGRSLGFLAWHLVITIGEMGGRAGLKISAPDEHATVPSVAADIIHAYETASTSIESAVMSGWSDASLADMVNMYGEKWSRRTVLYALVKHQTHHRAQMTVLMRQAHLAVPGMYGPAREEWATMGMPPQP